MTQGQVKDRWAGLQVLKAEDAAPEEFAAGLRAYLVAHPMAVPWRSRVRPSGANSLAAAYAGLNDDENDWSEWGVAAARRLDSHLPDVLVPTADEVHEALIAVCWGDVMLARDIEHRVGYAVVRARRLWRPELIPGWPKLGGTEPTDA